MSLKICSPPMTSKHSTPFSEPMVIKWILHGWSYKLYIDNMLNQTIEYIIQLNEEEQKKLEIQ